MMENKTDAYRFMPFINNGMPANWKKINVHLYFLWIYKITGRVQYGYLSKILSDIEFIQPCVKRTLLAKE